MFFKRLPRGKQSHRMLIGQAVRVFISALARDDDQCPNEIEIELDTDSIPRGAGKITVRIERLHGNNPSILIDAPREIAIRHESCGVLPNID
jgi:hypothetical protein